MLAGGSSGSGAARAPAGFSFDVVGDIGMSPAASATLSAIGRSRPSFLLAIGDLSYNGPNSAPGWCALVKQRLGKTPVEIVSGNHEDDTGGDGKIDTFVRCLPDRLHSHGAYGKQYYFDYGGLARFIIVSPSVTIDGKNYYYGVGRPEYRWLQKTIEDARAAHIPWVIVSMHKNCISVGEYYCQVYQDIFSLLVKEKVDLVLHGHDHIYQRSHQLAPSGECPTVVVDEFNPACIDDSGADGRYPKGKGLVDVIVGTGGAPLYPTNAKDPEAGYAVTYMGKNRQPRHGFLRVTVTRTRLDASFVGTTSTSTFTDRFTIAQR